MSEQALGTPGLGIWIGKFEAEIARELGQPVSVTAGGAAPEPAGSLADAIEIPGARLVLAADGEDVAAVLVEGRVVEAGQADAEMVRELWSGILSSVAGRLGGKAVPARPAEGGGEACTLRLGNAAMRLSLKVEAVKAEAAEGRADVTERKAEATESDARGPAPTRRETAAAERPAGNFDLLLEVELDAAVRFGSCEMELKDLLELGPGDVVELDRHVADPVDLIVGDKIVARGEVVLVNGNFGLRVIEVVEPVRRLESIRCIG